jgi:prenyltransferase beta subunit
MALWGLIEAHAISSSKQQQAVNYILSLQNHDGSFNLTRTEATNHFETLGPESISTTALVVLVLKSASLTASETHVSNALNFLSAASSTNFTASHDNKGHVYAAALSALAFNAFGRAVQATTAVAFILLQQNPDGGFRDIGRLSSGSNALDTGWAAIALEQVQPGPLFSPFLSPVLFVGLIVALGVVAVVGVVVAYLSLKRRARRPAASGAVSTLPTL